MNRTSVHCYQYTGCTFKIYQKFELFLGVILLSIENKEMLTAFRIFHRVSHRCSRFCNSVFYSIFFWFLVHCLLMFAPNCRENDRRIWNGNDSRIENSNRPVFHINWITFLYFLLKVKSPGWTNQIFDRFRNSNDDVCTMVEGITCLLITGMHNFWIL